jgi:hypothetical protein
MMAGLALDQWSDIAQCVIAIAAVLALGGAIVQIRSASRNARRVRAYEYADRFNRPEMRRRAGEWREYLEAHTYDDFKKLSWVERNELLLLANVIEEIAAMYHRRVVDRDVAAEAVGVYVEALWEVSQTFIVAARADKGPKIFCDWEAMVADTPARKLKADKKIARRRLWRKLLRG